MSSDRTWTIIRFLAAVTGTRRDASEAASSAPTRSAGASLGPTSPTSSPVSFTTSTTSTPHRRSATEQSCHQATVGAVNPRLKAEPFGGPTRHSSPTERVVVQHSDVRGASLRLGVLSCARSGSWYEKAPCRKPTGLRGRLKRSLEERVAAGGCPRNGVVPCGLTRLLQRVRWVSAADTRELICRTGMVAPPLGAHDSCTHLRRSSRISEGPAVARLG
jgi:hypothetical protein